MLFSFREPPTEVELAAAFASMLDALVEVPEGEFAEFVFTPDGGEWEGPRLATREEQDVLARRFTPPEQARPKPLLDSHHRVKGAELLLCGRYLCCPSLQETLKHL